MSKLTGSSGKDKAGRNYLQKNGERDYFPSSFEAATEALFFNS